LRLLNGEKEPDNLFSNNNGSYLKFSEARARKLTVPAGISINPCLEKLQIQDHTADKYRHVAR
jgi:hypothetical protein